GPFQYVPGDCETGGEKSGDVVAPESSLAPTRQLAYRLRRREKRLASPLRFCRNRHRRRSSDPSAFGFACRPRSHRWHVADREFLRTRKLLRILGTRCRAARRHFPGGLPESHRAVLVLQPWQKSTCAPLP